MRRVGWLGFALALLCICAGTAGAQGRPVRMGIVIDGPWERNAEIFGIFESEMRSLLGTEFEPSFTRIEQADFTLSGVSAAVEAVLADPQVDVLLAAGPIASNYVSRREEPLPKPAIAPLILDAEIQGVPNDNGTSGVRNLNYITFVSNLQLAAETFREVAPFERLTFLVNAGIAEAIPELDVAFGRSVEGLGIEVDVVPVRTSAQEALDVLGPDTEAVISVGLYQLGPGEFDRLVQGLIERRIPSFSVWGRSEVEAGMLMSIFRDADFERLARRVALNLQRILLGEDAGTLPVDFAREGQLTLNMATARAIDVSPSWGILTEAVVVGEASQPDERVLTLNEVVNEALAVNLELAVQVHAEAAERAAIGEARAELLPALDLDLAGRAIDADRARASFGAAPEYTLTAGLTLTQLIYADPAWANLEVSEYLADSEEYASQTIRLDIAQAAAQAYLNVLRAQTFERIQQDNLALTRTNLELAQVREAIGVSGPADALRFQSQIASNRQAVIEANAQRNLAEMALNQLLHRPLEEPFATTAIGLDDPALLTSANRMGPYLRTPADFRLFREFMVAEARANAPELQELNAGIAARERAVEAADRAFYTPTIGFQGDLDYVATAGEGTDGLEFPPGIPGLEAPAEPDDVNWTLTLFLNMPLFEGGGRGAAQQRTEAELAELTTQRELVSELLEQRIRTGLHRAGASYAAIALARDAADAASANLDLVSDAYARGAVAIPQLLDAQNAALVADEAAANAVYDYLIDFVDVQRAVGAFDATAAPEEVESFFERLDAWFESAGQPIVR